MKMILKNIAHDYQNIQKFLNCLGTIDRKDLRVICLVYSGSKFFNYKNFFSIVLQGLVEANCRFINIDVSDYGKRSDDLLCFYLLDGRMKIPDACALPNAEITMPFVLIGDGAYPLLRNLLKPCGTQHSCILDCQDIKSTKNA